MLRDLESVFTPEHFGILTKKEVGLIEATLHLKQMDLLQLRNLRDFTVLYYDNKKCSKEKEISTKDELNIIDIVSGVTSVIDLYIFNLGGEV